MGKSTVKNTAVFRPSPVDNSTFLTLNDLVASARGPSALYHRAHPESLPSDASAAIAKLSPPIQLDPSLAAAPQETFALRTTLCPRRAQSPLPEQISLPAIEADDYLLATLPRLAVGQAPASNVVQEQQGVARALRPLVKPLPLLAPVPVQISNFPPRPITAASQFTAQVSTKVALKHSRAASVPLVAPLLPPRLGQQDHQQHPVPQLPSANPNWNSTRTAQDAELPKGPRELSVPTPAMQQRPSQQPPLGRPLERPRERYLSNDPAYNTYLNEPLDHSLIQVLEHEAMHKMRLSRVSQAASCKLNITATTFRTRPNLVVTLNSHSQ